MRTTSAQFWNRKPRFYLLKFGRDMSWIHQLCKLPWWLQRELTGVLSFPYGVNNPTAPLSSGCISFVLFLFYLFLLEGTFGDRRGEIGKIVKVGGEIAQVD
eukprot:Gb_13537 [translate_table: standard]